MPADRFLHARLGHSAKVSSLSDLEYRVWTTYLLGADDFGVIRAEAVAFQAAHDALSRRPAKAIGRCIERLVKAGLVAAFVHQGARYLYQVDWQDFQRVRYPLRTLHPLPATAEVSPKTRHLWRPGGPALHVDVRGGRHRGRPRRADPSGVRPVCRGGAGFRAAAGQGFGQSATQLLGRFLNRLPTVTTAPDTGCACGRPRTSSCRGLSRTRKKMHR